MRKELSYLDLLEESFPGIKPNIIRCQKLGFHWGDQKEKLFIEEENGQTVSHAALLECPVLIDGERHNMSALHAICTKKEYRGRGLATKLIKKALLWAKKRCEATFLFTEIPSFYENLGFRSVQEYRFHLKHAHAKGGEPLIPLITPSDDALFLRCFQQREPLSNRFWLEDRGKIASFNALFASFPEFSPLYYSSKIDGLIAWHFEGKTAHLLDIVAAKIPPLEVVLQHLPSPIDEMFFYFPPDILGIQARPELHIYDKGYLMVHGTMECTQPFMIAPLSRC